MMKKSLAANLLLAMSAAVFFPAGGAWAMTFSEFTDGTEKGGTITVNEDTTVNSECAGNAGYLEAKEIVGDYDIVLAQDKTLTLNNLNMYHTTITGENGDHGGDIVVNITKPYSAQGSNTSGLVAGKTEDSVTEIKAHDLTITNTNNTTQNNKDSGIFVEGASEGNINIDLTGKLTIQSNLYGLALEQTAGGKLTTSDITIQAHEVSINGEAAGIFSNGDCTIQINAEQGIQISGITNNLENDSFLQLQAASNTIFADKESSLKEAIYNYDGVTMIESTAGDNRVIGEADKNGIRTNTLSDGVTLNAAQSNIIQAGADGVYSQYGSISLKAQVNNFVDAGGDGLKADGQNSAVTEEAEKVNQVKAGEVETVDYDGQKVTFGDSHAAYAVNGGEIYVKAGEANALAGAVYASGSGSGIVMSGLDEAADTVSNFVYSNAKIGGAGDLDDGREIISSLYAEDGAQISIRGDRNIIRTYADNTDENQIERTIWAYNKANITIDGQTIVSTDRYETSPNSLDIAIAAGTATGLDYDKVTTTVEDKDRAHVNLNYGAGSSITGDILAAYAGTVNISAQENSGAGIKVKGNILAGNNGVLSLDLGNGGVLTGRADDYGDAGLKTEGETIDEGHAGAEFFDPAFSSTIYKGGRVDLTMGEGSRWNVTGQSWITNVTTDGNAVIDLTGAGQERNEGADAITIYKMDGDATFLMHLDGDRKGSDMLYMKSADGRYTIYLDEVVDESDITGSHNELEFDNLRFATIGSGSKADFSVKYVGGGIYDIDYQVGNEGYASEKDKKKNDVYNGTELGEVKPGTGMVEDFFTQAGTPPEAETGGASGASVLAAEEEPEDAGDIGATNYYIYGAEKTVNDTGKTVIAMSKVNYSNAVYMDRLNKRMGEARFLEGDDGLWVRLRHDRIGKSDAFRSKNTMFEIGYDWKDNDQKDGTHYRGFAFDYMRGTADYTNVLGEGDVRRAGLWYHDTWMGDKGHYTDYVVKYGRLSNDFDIYGRTTGEKISGDYDNDVWSVSAEYGRKKDLGNDWYIEPQAQLQYAYVTDASYTTSQGTKVSLDSIDSLIGRAGFRLGRDTDEANTVYFKADILHEFLGGQSIRAMDSTGTLSTTYENEGTWYDVGFGFSHRMSEDKYMFLDVEKLFGNDNEDTYQVNIGLNMAF